MMIVRDNNINTVDDRDDDSDDDRDHDRDDDDNVTYEQQSAISY